MKRVFTSLSKKMALGLTLLMVPFMVHSQWVFEITSPSEIAGTYPMGIASFGSLPSDATTGNLQLAFDGSDNPALGCEALETDLSGTIGILDRGDCAFAEKALNAQEAGAIALVICNTADAIINMPGAAPDVNIQTVLLRRGDCDAIKSALASGDVSVEIYRERQEVIWGGEDDPNSTFDGGLNDWTTQVRTGFANTAEEDVFVWLPNGDVSEGLVSFDGNAINSPTASNGAAGMNLDLNTTEGTINPGAPPYPFYVAELISPVIDLSEVETPLSLSFYQLYRRLNFVGNNDFHSGFEYSLDGGNTWSQLIQLNDDVEIQERVNNQINLPLPLEVLGTEEFRMKFVISMDFYYWVIDDVVITELPANNIAISQPFNPLFSFATPANHIAADDLGFSFTLRNRGLEQELIEANVEIRDASNNELVHNQEFIIENLEGSIDSFIVFDDLFTPELPVGDYVITYRIDAPGKIDFDYTTNTRTYFFRVTENIHSKDNPDNEEFTSGTLQPDEDSWFYGNIYFTAPQEDNRTQYFIESQHAFRTDADEFTDELALIYLLEFVPDGLIGNYFEFINSDLNTTPDFHPALTQVAIAIVDASMMAEAGNGGLMTLDHTQFLDPNNDLAPFTEPIALNENKMYFLMTQIDQPAASTLRVATSSAVDYSVPNQLLFTQGRNWTGFTGSAVPVARMVTSHSTSTGELVPFDQPLMVYPVPASNELFIDFQLDQPTDMEIQLFDINGRLMNSSTFTNVTNETLGTDVTEYQTGNYIIRVVTKDGQVQSRQVLIVK
ncbi:MAG: T9SS C-terminal target domain-containing protein [Saprospirales bacterium]|nr:MAG: T9SS C-terminal target domain-containing protein [Saprospirales bacterium]